MTVTIGPADPADEAVAELLRSSDEYSASLYPPESVYTLSAEELRGPDVRFLVARTAAGPVGCGALVLTGAGTAELKRMFVAAPARRLGIGGRMLAALERVALDDGVRVVRLETGVSQPAAVALYRRFGYVERGPFGAYRDDPLSVFMEKQLG